jgi:glycosyl transferase family 25
MEAKGWATKLIGSSNQRNSISRPETTVHIPGYFLNLDRAVARRELMESQARRIGFELTRVAGVEGPALPQAELDRWNPPRRVWRKLGPFEIGCFLGHRQAWQRVAEGDAPYAAIFEDDILISDDASLLLSDDHWIPRDSHLVKLETFRQRVALLPTEDEVPGGRSLARLMSRHLGTAGYILSRDLARRLLATTSRFSVPVDWVLFSHHHMDFRRSKPLQLCPAICIQEQHAGPAVNFPEIEASDSMVYRENLKRTQAKSFLDDPSEIFRSVRWAFQYVTSELPKRSKAKSAGATWARVDYR